MSDNPYQPPRSAPTPLAEHSPLRKAARSSFRLVALVLLVPAIYNYVAFDARTIASGGLPSNVAATYRVINIFAFVVGFGLIWFAGFPLLEAVAKLLRAVFAKRADPAQWLEVLYRSLHRAVILAALGAALWAIWVFAFYQRGVDFYTISWTVGVPLHLLAACWYVPLVYRWYRMN